MTKHLYKVACARIVGRAHATSHTPCQDFVSVRKNSSTACIALADGAGSRPRSEIGSKAVVRAILKILFTQFDQIYSLCASGHDSARKAVHRHLIDALSREAIRHGCDLDSLASTLLFAAHKGDRFVAGHIGDGVIAAIDMTGMPFTLSHPENGEYANTTVFVTDTSAVNKFRLFHGENGGTITGFVLMSDGCAESLYEKKTGRPAAAISKLLAWNEELSRNKMEGILAANLDQAFSRKSADDCSVALLSIVGKGKNDQGEPSLPKEHS